MVGDARGEPYGGGGSTVRKGPPSAVPFNEHLIAAGLRFHCGVCSCLLPAVGMRLLLVVRRE